MNKEYKGYGTVEWKDNSKQVNLIAFSLIAFLVIGVLVIILSKKL